MQVSSTLTRVMLKKRKNLVRCPLKHKRFWQTAYVSAQFRNIKALYKGTIIPERARALAKANVYQYPHLPFNECSCEFLCYRYFGRIATFRYFVKILCVDNYSNILCISSSREEIYFFPKCT